MTMSLRKEKNGWGNGRHFGKDVVVKGGGVYGRLRDNAAGTGCERGGGRRREPV